ncbi:hypothetical protein JTB14_032407 [Gonioctena quinquepunctata]|nr:hypothetical protein JTB14_032407 [Gonioctena quinquepunctata]
MVLGPITLTDIIVSCTNFEVFNMKGISNHHSGNCNSKLEKEAQPTILKTYRDYSYFDDDSFLANLVNIRWDSIYGTVDVNEAIEFLSANILGPFDLHALLKTVRIKKRQPHGYLITSSSHQIQVIQNCRGLEGI